MKHLTKNITSPFANTHTLKELYNILCLKILKMALKTKQMALFKIKRENYHILGINMKIKNLQQ